MAQDCRSHCSGASKRTDLSIDPTRKSHIVAHADSVARGLAISCNFAPSTMTLKP
jgi:hypothetical protein